MLDVDGCLVKSIQYVEGARHVCSELLQESDELIFGWLCPLAHVASVNFLGEWEEKFVAFEALFHEDFKYLSYREPAVFAESQVTVGYADLAGTIRGTVFNLVDDQRPVGDNLVTDFRKQGVLNIREYRLARTRCNEF